MKKLKLLLVPVFFAASAVTFPTAASADPTTNCFLMAGCSWDSENQVWLCQDPLVYQDCVVPAG